MHPGGDESPTISYFFDAYRADVLQRSGPRAHSADPAAGLRSPPMQDPNYKRLFSFPRMVEDLLRGFLPGSWLAEVDFSTLRKFPTEYVSDELLKRHGDCVWRGGWWSGCETWMMMMS